MRRGGRRVAAACAVLAASGCGGPRQAPAPARPLTAPEAAQAEWPRTLALVQAAAARLEFTLADSVLRTFTERYPGTGRGADALYLRAVLRLDPAAAARDPGRDALREAAAALDAYLAGGAVQTHFAEAAALRRLAGQLDSMRAAAGGMRALPPTAGLRDSLKARDDEIARLRQELQATTAELERVRRRVAPPTRRP